VKYKRNDHLFIGRGVVSLEDGGRFKIQINPTYIPNYVSLIVDLGRITLFTFKHVLNIGSVTACALLTRNSTSVC